MYTCFGHPRIYILYYGRNEEHANLLHEFGHYFDTKFGDPSRTEEFQMILNEEYDSSLYPKEMNDYYKKPREFFAENFKVYLLNNDDINYPKTFDFIQSELKKHLY